MKRQLVQRLAPIAFASILLLSAVVPAYGAGDTPATPTAGMKRPEIPNTRKGRQCAQQCKVFRAQCLPYCHQTGHVPGSRTRAADCAKDCKDFESGCLCVCLGIPPQPQPENVRGSEAPSTAARAGPAPAARSSKDTSGGQ